MSRLADAALWADYLAQPISALEGCWLVVRCNCGQRGYPPLRMVRREHGDMSLSALLPRLRCERCKARPASLHLTNNLQSFMSGAGGPYPGTWMDELP